jgi:two-component SAPR family response regulator
LAWQCGIEVAKEILAVNPHQRIIFASAYVKDTVIDKIKNLKHLKESIQKPFGMQKLIDLIYAFPFYEHMKHIRDPSKVTLLSVRCLVLYLSLKI